MKTILSVLVTLIVITNISLASSLRRPPAHPPKESVLACEKQDDEDECEFIHEGNVLRGTCFSPNDAWPLACKPYVQPEKLANHDF